MRILGWVLLLSGAVFAAEIAEIKNRGFFLTLEDGTQWTVPMTGDTTSSTWKVRDPIHLIGQKKQLYMINLRTQERVAVSLGAKQITKSQGRWIISRRPKLLRLGDRSEWITKEKKGFPTAWKSGDYVTVTSDHRGNYTLVHLGKEGISWIPVEPR